MRIFRWVILRAGACFCAKMSLVWKCTFGVYNKKTFFVPHFKVAFPRECIARCCHSCRSHRLTDSTVYSPHNGWMGVRLTYNIGPCYIVHFICEHSLVRVVDYHAIFIMFQMTPVASCKNVIDVKIRDYMALRVDLNSYKVCSRRRQPINRSFTGFVCGAINSLSVTITIQRRQPQKTRGGLYIITKMITSLHDAIVSADERRLTAPPSIFHSQ